MAKKTSSHVLTRRLEKLIAALEQTLSEMAKSPELHADDMERLVGNLAACTHAHQALSLANLSLRRALRERCERLWREGKNRTQLRKIERLLDKNVQVTDDWEDEREGRIAEAIGLLAQAISLYDVLEKSPPLRRR